MPLFLIPLLSWLRRAAASIPWFAYAIAGLFAALAISHHSARSWHRRYDVAQASIDALAKAQRAANFAAKANKVRVETAQIIVTKEADHATDIALAGVRSDYASLRLRYAALARHPGPGVVSGVSSGPGVVDCPVTAAAAGPSPELIDFAEQGDVLRQRLADAKDWYERQAAVDRVSPPQ